MPNTPDPVRPLRVLVIDEYFPYPPDSGKPIRTWNLLSRLSRNHQITMLCYGKGDNLPPSAVGAIKPVFVDPLEDYTGLKLYARLALNLFSRYPYSVTKHKTPRFRQRLRELLASDSYDLVQCEWTPYAAYLDVVDGLPTAIPTHNVESQIWRRRAQNSKTAFERWFFGIQAKKMEAFERDAVRRATVVTAVSPEDAKTLSGWRGGPVPVVDNGVDLAFYEGKPTQENDLELLFLASLDWQPNIEGLDYFLESIFPLIREKQPKVKLTVAGRRPSAELRERVAKIPNVDFLGEVSDVRATIERAGVIVVPLLTGGGSRLKILEAMAMSKAIISTSIGAEGLAVQDGEQLMMADTPQSFADVCLALMPAPDRRRQLGAAGRRLVEDMYGWDRCSAKLEAAWHEAVGQTHAAKAQP